MKETISIRLNRDTILRVRQILNDPLRPSKAKYGAMSSLIQSLLDKWVAEALKTRSISPEDHSTHD